MTQMANSFTETTVQESMGHDMAPITAVPLAAHDSPSSADRLTGRAALTKRVALGAFGGLTWGAALRALMVIFALQFGEQPHFTWNGTFVVILLPSALMGALLGAAAYLTACSGQKRWRWAILSPLLLVVFPLLFLEDFIPALITTGIGSGAIFVALIGVLGGYAFSGFGRRWMRWGVVLLIVSLSVADIVAGGGVASLLDARDVFAMMYSVLLLALLIGGVSLPFRLGRDTQVTSVLGDHKG